MNGSAQNVAHLGFIYIPIQNEQRTRAKFRMRSPFPALLHLRQNDCVAPASSREGLHGMAGWGKALCRLLALIVLVGVGGCSAAARGALLETAHSAIGAQVK
jgi:hypothetical protein